jgi:hypothetical protein
MSPLSALAALIVAGVWALGIAQAAPLYTAADFPTVRKFDAHVHANTASGTLMDIAARDGFEVLSINVDYPAFPSLDVQAQVSHTLMAAHPQQFHFATSFSMKGFGQPQWEARTIQHIDEEVTRGAVAVKVWKNIGMVEKDSHGRYIMLDDHGFDGVITHLEEAHIPLIAHQAEPKNCWLPLDQMTTDNDRSYFKEHPEYYMYLHPEMPSYETLMAARDRFVARHPKLVFDGAHLASLEWSVKRLAKFLDDYPNANVDLAARMTQVQYQSARHYAAVRQFFLKYQDRLLYGTDLTEDPDDLTLPAEADAFWRSDWSYLATPDAQHIDAIRSDVTGLALPREVIDKIYFKNAMRVFRLPRNAAQ